MSDETKTRALPVVLPRPSDERCPSFDEDCFMMEAGTHYHCWNNTDGEFDTTRPGYCPIIHEVPDE